VRVGHSHTEQREVLRCPTGKDDSAAQNGRPASLLSVVPSSPGSLARKETQSQYALPAGSLRCVRELAGSHACAPQQRSVPALPGPNAPADSRTEGRGVRLRSTNPRPLSRRDPRVKRSSLDLLGRVRAKEKPFAPPG
jgi:hypothetical protein